MDHNNVDPKQEDVLDSAGDEDGIRIGDIYIPPRPLPACTFDVTGPRIVISLIENTNFKSYAGLQTLGPFHKNFSAIVGANGTGKSNVIDAVLFVFGYRAQKIRSKKISVLIHNSHEHPDIQSCTVKVHFQKIKDTGENTYDIIPDSAFCISRTVFRDNSSCYEIDGRRVQFKKVGALLRSYGIDLNHNRFLILQGEIEMIAMMKPKGSEQDVGMLEYLEEIIGSSRFIEPIAQFFKRVQELNDIRTEKLNRIKLMEKEKEDLKVIKNEAIKYIKLENKVALLQNKMYQVQKQNKENEIEQLKANRDLTKLELGKLETEEEGIRCKREVKERQYAEVQMQFEKQEVAFEEAVEEFQGLQRMDVVCRDNIDFTRAKLKKLAKSLEAEEAKLVELKKIQTARGGEVSELEKKKHNIKRKKENEERKLGKVMANAGNETRIFREKKEMEETKLIDMKKVVNTVRAKIDMIQMELDMTFSYEKREQAKLKEFERKLKEIIAAIIELKEKLYAVELSAPAAKNYLQGLENQKQQLVIKEASYSEEVIRSKEVKLEEARSALSFSSQCHKRSVISQFLMEQKQLGNISGILGRLGDLGEIDDKYDAAISTTCGRLDNMVTDTVEAAQLCITYLKKYNKGYCTFIALDKMQRWEPCAKQVNIAESPYPEKVPRLFDLIKVNDVRVLPAFYYALRDTLVADDIDQAIRVGMNGPKRHKVVTLNGEVIDTCGTMTGGGRVSRGRMGKMSGTCVVDVTPQDVERLERSLEDAKKTAKELKEKRVSLVKEISIAEKKYTALKFQLCKCKNEYSGCKKREIIMSKQIADQKSKVLAAAPDKEKVDEIMTKLDRAKKSYVEASKAAENVEIKVKQLHAKITSITATRYGSLQKVCDKLSKELSTIRSNINISANAVKSACRNQEKTENKIKSLNEDIKETKENLEQLMKEYKELAAKATKSVESKTSLENDVKELSNQKQNIRKEVNEQRNSEHEFKSKMIDMKHALRMLEAELKEKKDALRRIESCLCKLYLQDIDDCDDPLTFPTLTPPELEVSVIDISYEIRTIETQMNKMKPNKSAIAEYMIKEEFYKTKMDEFEQITKEKDKMKKHFNDLRKQRIVEFMTGFKIISSKLKEVYQMITLGGDAELELKDPLNPFSAGILFSVRPPKKSWKSITSLSGGEKTLSSLALVLALHYYKPTPFYVMDEIDAALDVHNVSIVGHYIKESTKNAQFIVVSLHPNMFEIADSLIGIYKPSACTNAITVSPDIVMLQAKDEVTILDTSSAEDTEEKSSPGLVAAMSACAFLPDTEGQSSSGNGSKDLDLPSHVTPENSASSSEEQQSEE